MERAARELAEKIDGLVEQLGRLPDAPLMMPKQRLEAPMRILGLFDRIVGRATPVADARGNGR